MDIKIFTDLAKKFKSSGYSLYMVGGTSRDYLLGRPITDFDLSTDAIPSEIKTFLPDADFTFSHYGSVKLKVGGKNVDITTLRQEEKYKDHRHPSSVSFISQIKLDYPRRDFTINAIYINDLLEVFDFAGGVEDIKNKIIRTIGEPNERFQEDPLRLLRALRFKLKLGFELEQKTARAIKNNWDLLEFLNPAKVSEEMAKMKRIDAAAAEQLIAQYSSQ